ncbi:MAG TPA: MFS transporter [Blastocatellia bacterium]|nr:MFS transporter [Blastocatellia bacterium]
MSFQKRATYALIILFLINTMNFFDRQILAAVTEPIRKEWGLSDTAMGWLGTAFTLIYAFVGVPLGRWADRGSRKTILAAGVTVWSLFTAASGMAWGYWSLFWARMGVGVGEASCSPAANSMIGDMFPASKRARAISIFMLGLPIGIFLSNLLSGYIAKAFGWQMTFFIATIPGLILAALAFGIAEPKRGAAEDHKIEVQQDGHSFWYPYIRVLSIPTMWWIALSGALHNFNAYAVNAFTPAYLGRYHGLDLREANTVAAFTLGLVGILGLLGGGVLADWARRWRANGRMLVAALALLISTPCVFLAISQPKGAYQGFIAWMSVGWMLIYVYYVTVYSAIQDIVEPNLRGTAMALYFFAMYVLGGAFGTSILGMLSDYFAKSAMIAAGAALVNNAIPEQFRAIGLHNAFYVVPLVSLLLALVLFAGAGTITKDMKRLQDWLRQAGK